MLMVDEMTDREEISNDSKKPATTGVSQQSQATQPEVKILEEHVTRVAQKPVLQDNDKGIAPPVQNIPSPAIELSAKPTLPASPVVASVAQPVASKTPPLPPPAPVQEKPLPRPTEKKRALSDPSGPALGNDIARILAEVKLPERRDPATSTEKPPLPKSKQFDTGIIGSALDEETPNPHSQNSQEGAAITPQVPAPAAPSDETKVSEKDSSSVVAVHTLKDDLRGVVHDQKISVVRAVSLEEDRRAHKGLNTEETEGTRQRSSRVLGVLFASLTLIGLGAGALFGVIYVMNQQQVVPKIDTGTSILFAEQSVLLPLDAQSPEELRRALRTGRAASQGALGSITRIIPVVAETSTDGTPQNRPATFKEFMVAIGAHPPDDLLRALGNDFFLGIHAVDRSSPLIVIPVTSHGRAFAAMLSWEETLNPDLVPLFSFVPTLKVDGNGVPSKRIYEDVVMRNYDVRALKDNIGEIQMYYSFPTQNILVIAESPYSFPEILSRLQASRQL